MKRIFLLAFIFSLLVNTAQAQDAWDPLTSGTTKGINDFYFSSVSSGYAVGQAGLLQLTSNGGATWSPVSISATQNLQQIKFPESNKGWIVCSDGSVYNSSNGGSTWTGKSLGSDGLNAIDWQGLKGIIVGDNGKTHSTSDGGTNWTYNGTLGVFTLNDVIYFNDTLAIACGGNGSLFRSVDNGASWTTVPSGTTESLSAISKANDGTLKIVGTSGTILSYSALTGTLLKEGSGLTTDWLTDVHCTDSYCYAVGTNQTVLIKGSGAWFKGDFDDAGSFTAVHFANAKTGFIGGIGGKLFKTTTAAGLISAESIGSQQLSLAPNPAKEWIKVTGIQGEFHFEIYNLTGALIMTSHSNDASINISTLPTGYYLMRLSDKNSAQMLKFFKQ